MTPSECKQAIRCEYLRLVELADKRKVNRSAIFGLIRERCRDAARHNGVDALSYYMPDELIKEMEWSPPQ